MHAYNFLNNKFLKNNNNYLLNYKHFLILYLTKKNYTKFKFKIFQNKL